MKSQGALANLNGHVFEQMMIPLFEASGFAVMTAREHARLPEAERPPKCVLRNVPFTTIYGHPGKTEFVIVCGDRRIRVEAKRMGSAGSVDEKVPYMLLNGIEKYPEAEIVFVLDGSGWKRGALQWLRDRISEDWMGFRESGKDIRTMNVSEFMDWFNREEWVA